MTRDEALKRLAKPMFVKSMSLRFDVQDILECKDFSESERGLLEKARTQLTDIISAFLTIGSSEQPK